jgi:hypothetical protein
VRKARTNFGLCSVTLCWLLTLQASCLVSIPELRDESGAAGLGGGAGAGAGAAGSGQSGSGAVELPVRCSTAFAPGSTARAWPADAGLIDVTAEPYLAAGDGTTDDTAALQQAISDHVGTGRIVLLPAGTYLVTDTLDAVDALGEPRRAITLQGAGRDLTKVVLAIDAMGFDEPTEPKPVVRLNGESAGQAVRNHVMDLAIDVGAHPGAVGLDFVGHNRSSVENVRISAEPNGGAIGLMLERPWAGSRLIRNVEIEGFDIGVSVALEKFGNTFEHLRLSGQREVGLRNDRSFTAIRDLQSNNQVPAIHSTHALGMLVLVEADLIGGAAEQPAVSSEGELFARDIVVAGYGPSVELRGLEVARGNIAEFSSREPARLAASGQGSLGLPILDTPEPASPPLADWVSVVEHGAIPDDELDDAAAIQAALDSGAPAVYLPFGDYLVASTLTIPPSLSLLFGAESTLRIASTGAFESVADAALAPLLRVAEGSAPLRVERLLIATEEDAEVQALLFEHAAPREVTLALLEGNHLGHWPLLYRAEPGAGPVFFHCVHAGGIRLVEGQKAWLRAGNFEADQPMIENAGAELWALGLKSYTPHTLIATQDGGKTELLGAFLLPEPQEAAPSPAFTVTDAEASLIFATFTDREEGEYPVHVREARGASTQELLPDAERVLGVGSYVPLFVGHERDARLCQ